MADRDTNNVKPVPLSAMLWGDVMALSVILIAAVSAPVTVGAKCP